MAEPVKINTSKYTRQGKVDIDGNIWSVVLPGAGTEMSFSQASKLCRLYGARIGLLDKKIDSGTATLTDLDQYEDYCNKYQENEKVLYEIFNSTFRDGTKDNGSVSKWIYETPTAIIMLAFEDVKSKAESTGNDGLKEPTSST